MLLYWLICFATPRQAPEPGGKGGGLQGLDSVRFVLAIILIVLRTILAHDAFVIQ